MTMHLSKALPLLSLIFAPLLCASPITYTITATGYIGGAQVTVPDFIRENTLFLVDQLDWCGAGETRHTCSLLGISTPYGDYGASIGLYEKIFDVQSFILLAAWDKSVDLLHTGTFYSVWASLESGVTMTIVDHARSSEVPEPASLGLVGLMLISLGLIRSKHARRLLGRTVDPVIIESVSGQTGKIN